MERGRLAVRAIEERSETDAGALAQFRRWAQDGKAAENDLVAHNQRLVMSIARLFSSFESPGLDHEDLIQEGWAGLAHAVEKWDYRRGLKFSTYGTWWIRQAMSRAVADRGSTIRLPVHSREALNAILRAEAVLLAQGKRPSNRALSKVTSLSEARVKELLSWRNRMSSLDRMIELGVPLVELDRSEESPEHFAEIAVLVDQVSELVGSLSERDADVIRRRFGLEGRPVETLDQIGKRRGVTRERIRQIEERALRQLRSQAEALHDFTAED
jgi:RNA polymerase sigma factor (sigma-70 family)